MADANVNEVPAGKVRQSFIVAVDVDESASYDDIIFINPNQNSAVLAKYLSESDEVLFFEGQESLAARWMAMGKGALPLSLFMCSGPQIAPAPTNDVRQALSILNQLYNNGDLDNLQTDDAYDRLRQMEALLVNAEAALSN